MKIKIKYKIPIVNWPDYQCRLFLNSSYIKWERKLHEKVEGAKITAFLPANYDLAILHQKSIETQIATNERYNREFSEDDNKGFQIRG